MKRLSRLTALLLAIMMVCTMVASAETGGVSVENWTFGDYQKAVEAASEVPAEEGMDDPWGLVGECGDDNIYCGYAKELIALGTAQERYDRMMELYNDPEDSVALEMTMAHYYGIEEHNATGVLCTCNFPAYVPGDISLHEETCPWYFVNLSTAEQYDVVMTLETEEKPAYAAELTAVKGTGAADALHDYFVSQMGTCTDPECDYLSFAALPSGFARWQQLSDWVGTPDEELGNKYNRFLDHMLRMHADSDLMCWCTPFMPETDIYGSITHTKGKDFNFVDIDCPWHFKNLTVEEQYMVYLGLSQEEIPDYIATLTKDQLQALSEYIMNAGINTDDKAVIMDEDGAVVVELTISIPKDAFAADYELNAAAANLDEPQKAAIEAHGATSMAEFDIAFIDVNSGSAVQPSQPVELIFALDGTKVPYEILQIYHLKDNGDGTFTAAAMGDPINVADAGATLAIWIQATEFSSAWVVGGRMKTEADKPVTIKTDEEGTFLMCDGEELAIVNANGYVIDRATGIAVGTYNEADGLNLGVN